MDPRARNFQAYSPPMPVTSWSTTCPSGVGRSSGAVNGARARASIHLRRSARGWRVRASRETGSLALTLDVNGTARQRVNTADMIFDTDTIVSYCSQFMTLGPGCLIITGTPAGVGIG